MYWPK